MPLPYLPHNQERIHHEDACPVHSLDPDRSHASRGSRGYLVPEASPRPDRLLPCGARPALRSSDRTTPPDGVVDR